MKKRFMGMEFEISEWTPKLRYAVIFFALLSLIFLILSLFFKIDIPGAFCLSAGVVALLLGIRFINIYLKKKKKNKISLSLGVAFVIIFAALISISIIQMVLFFRSVI